MPVIEGGEIPAGARDITEDVVELKSELNDLFESKDMTVIATAIGAVIGENLTDTETIKQFLLLICGNAGEHFALCNPDVQAPEGARLQ